MIPNVRFDWQSGRFRSPHQWRDFCKRSNYRGYPQQPRTVAYTPDRGDYTYRYISPIFFIVSDGTDRSITLQTLKAIDRNSLLLLWLHLIEKRKHQHPQLPLPQSPLFPEKLHIHITSPLLLHRHLHRPLIQCHAK